MESRGAGIGDERVKDKQPQVQTSPLTAAELFLSGGRWEGYKPQSPMNGRGSEVVDSDSLPHDNTWLL